MELFDPVEYETSIIKRNLVTYKPNIESYNYNDRIKITVNSSSFIELYNSHIYLKLKVKELPAAAANKKIAFVQNGIMQMFNEVIFEQNGVMIENVTNPGLCHLVMSLLVNDKDEASGVSEYGFESFSVEENDTFDVVIPLKNFLNFARDYKKFLIYSRFDLTLIRARNDYNAVMCAEAAAAEKAEITIEKLAWRIPHINLNDVLKLKVLKNVEMGKDILMPFRSVEYHEYTSLPISKYFSSMLKTSVKRPLFAIALFQTDKHYNLKVNNSKFDHLNVRSIRLWVNAEPSPFETLDINFSTNHFSDAYNMYRNMRMAIDEKKEQ